jgi:hypothetical protein
MTPDTSADVSVTAPVRPATLLTIADAATSSHADPVHDQVLPFAENVWLVVGLLGSESDMGVPA